MRRATQSFSSEERRSGGKFAAGFLAVGFILVAGGAYFVNRTAQKVHAVESWPTTPAYVIESRIEWDVTSSTTSGRRSHSYFYRLHVLAGYRVGGRFFLNRDPAITIVKDAKFYPQDPWKNPPDEDIVTLFRKLPQGTLVPIHYNPDDPSESYFFAALPFWNLYIGPVVAIIFGVVFSLPGFLIRKVLRAPVHPRHPDSYRL